MPLASLLLAALAVSPADSRRVAELARRSLREYNIGEFAQALRDVQKAYLIEPAPVLLFNAAKCEQALEHWSLAERFYRNYLSALPNARDRAQTEKLIAEMVEKQRPAPASAVARPPIASPASRAIAPPAVAPVATVPPAPGSGSTRAAPNGRARGAVAVSPHPALAVPAVAKAVPAQRAASNPAAGHKAPPYVSSTGGSIGNVGRGLVPRRPESRDASRARETPSVASARGPRLAAASPPSAERAPQPAPAAAVTSPQPHRQRTLAWGLGATAAACAAVAVAGFVEAGTYDGVAAGVGQTTDWTTFQARTAQAQPGLGAARAWWIAAVIAATAAVAFGVGSGLTW